MIMEIQDINNTIDMHFFNHMYFKTNLSIYMYNIKCKLCKNLYLYIVKVDSDFRSDKAQTHLKHYIQYG